MDDNISLIRSTTSSFRCRAVGQKLDLNAEIPAFSACRANISPFIMLLW
jgi:hypothetical protein